MDGVEHWKARIQELIDPLQQEILRRVQRIPDTQLYTAIGVIVVTVILSLILHLSKRKKSNSIVLAGLSGSGKTVLFYQGKINPVHIVDVLGHSRLRPKLDDYLPQSAGLVFVVDALEFLSTCHADVEYLYDILTKATVVKKKVPVLLLCNKTEKVTAHSKEFILSSWSRRSTNLGHQGMLYLMRISLVNTPSGYLDNHLHSLSAPTE